MLIGDFARLGQVSVRMLRHYDQIGLLRPTHVDEWNGYRQYAPEQLGILNRIVALRDLGFTLDQIAGILAGGVSGAELQGMFRLRQAQIEEDVRAAGIRLAAVESRLRMISKENTMPVDVVRKSVPTQQLAALTATMPREEFVPRIGEMFAEAAELLAPTGASLDVSMATYAEHEGGTDVVVGYPVNAEVAAHLPEGLTLVVLPAVTAACGVHLGEMARIHESWQELYRSAVESGYTPTGPCREVYLKTHPAPQAEWVTELQQPITD